MKITALIFSIVPLLTIHAQDVLGEDTQTVQEEAKNLAREEDNVIAAAPDAHGSGAVVTLEKGALDDEEGAILKEEDGFDDEDAVFLEDDASDENAIALFEEASALAPQAPPAPLVQPTLPLEFSQPQFSIPNTSPALAPPPSLPPRKNEGIAAGLSALIPGLGHFYLNDTREASWLMGTSGVGLGTMLLGGTNDNEDLFYTGLLTYKMVSCYGVYAAYRDARKYNRNEGYSYPMPMDSFNDLATAPLNITILKKPEVWGGIFGFLGAGLELEYLIYRYHVSHASTKPHAASSRAARGAILLTQAFPIALSEEALFRGYLQSAIAEASNPVAGIVLSSIVFAAAHIPNARAFHLSRQRRRDYYTFTVPFLGVVGAYLGWLTYHNHSLKESVAVHAWYDWVLFATDFFFSGAISGVSHIALPLNF